MKKLISVLLVLAVFLSFPAAFADNMGVQLLNAPEIETEEVSLDDIKLSKEIEIDGFGIVTPTNFAYYNKLYDLDGSDPDSGKEADYAVLNFDIINTSTKDVDFLAECSVKVIYDDLYEYGGWYHQQNFNRDIDLDTYVGENKMFSISPMYCGHYMFGCTLPNAVVNGKKPLRMEITLGENEFTYNIRK